ncbi:polysaccharide deacetylase family protein [Robertkochia solimangrovi]|uniref:polysaccharide deacetylase family protein n=1 Tax=Robertkochia solimangrovi TaxID=2213046 RepID=UPI00117D1088|nr:polysaccharide deacetylase family protein [Robertkochia solimangrovi]TRZ42830.1 hypothetical protein DMZ48_12225 [Robertkochia solimangrovi]
MRKHITALFILAFLFSGMAQQNLAERLGYTKDTKLLIIHADDIGIAHSVNDASFTAMKEGSVNSGSIITVGPWMEEVAEMAKEFPQADLGVHLALTSEWLHYKWRPLTEGKSFTTEFGYFYATCAEATKNVILAELEEEMRAQIEFAIKNGIQPTHLDNHMGCLTTGDPELLQLYLKLGRMYEIPVMLTKSQVPPSIKKNLTKTAVLLDALYIAGPEDYKNGMAAYYTKVIRNLKPGLNQIILHAAHDDAEMQQICYGHRNWGSDWRQKDYYYFTSERVQRLLEENEIRLISWREIREILFNAD